MFNQLFNKEEINTGRQLEWDFVKVLAIIFMICTHPFDYAGFDQLLSPYLYLIFDTILGGPFSAPVFMIAMGLGMVYTRHNSPKDFIKRGIYLFVIGYILNILLFLIDFWLLGPEESPISIIFGVDILQFAALAFIVIGIFKKLGFDYKLILIISIILSLFATIIGGISIPNIYLGQIIGYILPVYNVASYFPLFNWLIFPAVGMAFAKLLMRCNDKSKLYLPMIVFFIIGCILIIFELKYSLGIYYTSPLHIEGLIGLYYMSTFSCIICILITLGLVSICYFVLTYINSLKFEEFIKRSSKNVTIIYFIQYILIFTILRIFVFYGFITSDFVGMLFIIICVIASFVLARFYVYLKTHLIKLT